MRTPWVSLIWSYQRTRTYLFMGFGLFLRSNWAHSWLHVGQQHFFFLSKYSFIVDIWFNGYDFVFFLLLLCLCVIIFYLFILTSHISLFIWYSWVCIISVRDDWKGTSIIIKIYAISSQQMQIGAACLIGIVFGVKRGMQISGQLGHRNRWNLCTRNLEYVDMNFRVGLLSWLSEYGEAIKGKSI